MARPTILLVDDDMATAAVVRYTCHDAAFAAVWAATAEEARAALQLVRVDLILCDVMLPGTSGLTLAPAMQAMQAVPVVLLSALPAAAIAAPPGITVLTKPLAPRHLLALILQLVPGATWTCPVPPQNTPR